MNHVDYSAWVEYIISILERFHPETRTILETACGTGTLSQKLCQKGYSVICSDISSPMVKKAAVKFKEHGLPVFCFVADISALPVVQKFDAILCLYDSINYFLTPEDFRHAVLEMSTVVADNGLFIFDICTVKNSELFFTGSTIVDTFDTITYERTCRFDRKKSIQENHFCLVLPGNRKVIESHYQKIYRLEEISQMLDGMPFIELGRFNDMSFVPGTEDSERVHFVLQKNEKDGAQV